MESGGGRSGYWAGPKQGDVVGGKGTQAKGKAKWWGCSKGTSLFDLCTVF